MHKVLDIWSVYFFWKCFKILWSQVLFICTIFFFVLYHHVSPIFISLHIRAHTVMFAMIDYQINMTNLWLTPCGKDRHHFYHWTHKINFVSCDWLKINKQVYEEHMSSSSRRRTQPHDKPWLTWRSSMTTMTSKCLEDDELVIHCSLCSKKNDFRSLFIFSGSVCS